MDKETQRGFILGASEDGTIYFRPKKNQYNIEIEQKVSNWLETVKTSLQDVYRLNINIRQTSRGYYRLTVLSKQLYTELLNFRKDYNKVLFENKNFQLGFLQGIFDAEGTVHNKRNQIRISSKNKTVMEITRKLLNKFGINTGKLYKDLAVFVLPFYGKDNMKMFAKNIGFRHPEKKQRLSVLISN
jgi:intein/homing endonuclease